MAKFKCILSGNIFEFVHDFDIDEMRKHPQYEEIEDGLQEEQDSKEKVKKPRKAKEAK